MALKKHLNTKAKTDDATGFGSISTMYGGRFVNKDGIANSYKSGIAWYEKISWYHYLLQLNRWKFLFLILFTFLLINIFFAFIYLLIGVHHLAGINVATPFEKITEAFFFSTQTFTTVGYGRLAPTGILMSLVSSFEALVGLLSFALATGLLYGRFSRPQAFLKFSHNALIAPYKNAKAVMLRMAPYKNNHLTDAEVKLNLAIMVDDNGSMVNRFYPLKLELEKVNALSLSWTIVHAIDADSPFNGLSQQDLIMGNAEVLVFVKAFDDTFSNTVVSRTSYTASEFVFDAKFEPMYHRNTKLGKTVLELDKLNSYKLVN
jgi:inward rectifier potassium channel